MMESPLEEGAEGKEQVHQCNGWRRCKLRHPVCVEHHLATRNIFHEF